MTVQPVDPNKVLDDATVALEGLFRVFSSGGYDVDYVPNEILRKANESLQKLQETVRNDPDVLSQFKRPGAFKDVMTKLDTPAIQTALGTLASELMGVFKKVQPLFYEKDTRRVSGKDSDMLRNR